MLSAASYLSKVKLDSKPNLVADSTYPQLIKYLSISIMTFRRLSLIRYSSLSRDSESILILLSILMRQVQGLTRIASVENYDLFKKIYQKSQMARVHQ